MHDHKDWKNPKKTAYDPKPFADYDVDIRIEACGVCGSDVHCAAGNWGQKQTPLVVGHEVIGRIVRVGPKAVGELKEGDRVGVGAQVFSCLDCDRCKANNEPYCQQFVTTYSQPYGKGNPAEGYVSQGGYANYIRVHSHFAVPIPEKIPSHLAAPLMCGGLTVYSPLKRNGCKPGANVGIVGIGGIGHMGLLFAKAMGAKEVVAISRSSAKKDDAMKLGATDFIATKEDSDWASKYFDRFDVIIICAGSLTDVDFDSLARVMKIGGKIVSICVPEESETLSLRPFGLMGVSIGNSMLGSIEEVKELLQLVADNDIKIWVETLPVGEKGVSEAFERMDKGDVRYRFTLVDFDKEFN